MEESVIREIFEEVVSGKENGILTFVISFGGSVLATLLVVIGALWRKLETVNRESRSSELEMSKVINVIANEYTKSGGDISKIVDYTNFAKPKLESIEKSIDSQ